jgi:hypothetical protein
MKKASGIRHQASGGVRVQRIGMSIGYAPRGSNRALIATPYTESLKPGA